MHLCASDLCGALGKGLYILMSLSYYRTGRLTAVYIIALIPNDNTCNAKGDILRMVKIPYRHFDMTGTYSIHTVTG